MSFDTFYPIYDTCTTENKKDEFYSANENHKRCMCCEGAGLNCFECSMYNSK